MLYLGRGCPVFNVNPWRSSETFSGPCDGVSLISTLYPLSRRRNATLLLVPWQMFQQVPSFSAASSKVSSPKLLPCGSHSRLYALQNITSLTASIVVSAVIYPSYPCNLHFLLLHSYHILPSVILNF